MKTIRKYFTINATPEEVYTALTNPLTIELWSGYPAQMEARQDSEFSIFGGDISGRNISMVPGKQLVQEWYFGDQEEQSLVTIDLIPEKRKTKVSLTHTNVPEELHDEFEQGWTKYYFGAIMKFFK